MAIAARYRDEFPVTKELIYLNHAAVSPLCRRAAEAIRWLADDACQFGSLHYDKWMESYAGLRKATARLINASPEEIAIVKNTSEGIAMVALGLDWKAGDRVVAFREEFPANYYPWLRLEKARRPSHLAFDLRSDLKRLPKPSPARACWPSAFVQLPERVSSGSGGDRQALPRARLLLLCRCHSGHGRVSRLMCETSYIDALAADGHKWMLGPEGNGVLYVRRKWLDADRAG